MHEITSRRQKKEPSNNYDDTDSTATVTTAAFTSVRELEWDDDIAERLAGTITLNNSMSLGKDDG